MSRIQKIAGIVFHNGNDDYTLLIPDLSADENDRILRNLVDIFETNGSSIRGTKEDILTELNNNI